MNEKTRNKIVIISIIIALFLGMFGSIFKLNNYINSFEEECYDHQTRIEYEVVTPGEQCFYEYPEVLSHPDIIEVTKDNVTLVLDYGTYFGMYQECLRDTEPKVREVSKNVCIKTHLVRHEK